MEGKIRRNKLLYQIIRGIGQVCFYSLYGLKVDGREKIPLDGPGIILPKHQFWTDIPIVGLAAQKPLSFIAKQELFFYPVIRHFITAVGGIPVDRQNPVKSLDSFRYVEHLLKKGEFIVLFPEGTYYPNSMGGGKHRFIQRILRVQGKMGWKGVKRIPFIPMGIRYDAKKFRTEVQVKIGRPLYADGEADGPEFTRRILSDIAELSGLIKTGVEESRIQA
jgi:1-acyl-sn-glycerol-3-phosphate acyltransferase